MKSIITTLIIFFQIVACTQKEVLTSESIPIDGPIQLHPANPHYFAYKGKPLALITSAEHYGAVLNLGFDYRTYLAALANEGMNYTRIFTGTYFEIAGESFGIQHNTLAPVKKDICTPWAMVVSDLSGWSERSHVASGGHGAGRAGWTRFTSLVGLPGHRDSALRLFFSPEIRIGDCGGDFRHSSHDGCRDRKTGGH